MSESRSGSMSEAMSESISEVKSGSISEAMSESQMNQ